MKNQSTQRWDGSMPTIEQILDVAHREWVDKAEGDFATLEREALGLKP
jgi:hypothetical protein